MCANLKNGQGTSQKTLEDLELFRVTEQIADFAITPMGKASCIALEPLPDQDTMLKELHTVSEYLASFDNDNRYQIMDLKTPQAFQLLKIENSVLEITAFRNIAAASQTVNTYCYSLINSRPTILSALLKGMEVNENQRNRQRY